MTAVMALALALLAALPLQGVAGKETASKIEVYDRYTLHECTDPNGTEVLNDPTEIAKPDQYFTEVEIEDIVVVSPIPPPPLPLPHSHKNRPVTEARAPGRAEPKHSYTRATARQNCVATRAHHCKYHFCTL